LDFGGGEGVKVIDQGVNLSIQAVAAAGVKMREFPVGPENGNQFFDPSESFVEARWHGGIECAPEIWQRQFLPESVSKVIRL
jgi:hypothetical protein